MWVRPRPPHQTDPLPKRLVERFGYDTKAASHLVRLLTMGEEFLRTGHLQVRRTTDAPTLLAIKRGEWLLPDIREYAAVVRGRCEEALRLSPLPEEIDRAAVERLVVRVLADALAEQVEQARTPTAPDLSTPLWS